MNEHSIFLFTALLVFTYGLFSRLSQRLPISAAAVFVSVGIVAGPVGLDFLEPAVTGSGIRVIAELALVLVLFTDASTVNLKSLARRRSIPLRLLLIGLPLTMVLGGVFAIPIFKNLGLWTAALMAFILSPTDAALGQPVVTGTLVPEKIREAINVESGLNDGMVLPPILVCIAALTPEAEGNGVGYWVAFVAKQLMLGPLLGALVGWVGGKAVDRASRLGWMSHAFQGLAAWSLAVLAYGVAEAFHGNGFIAAYFGGLTLGAHTPTVREKIQEFGEAEGQQLALFVFLLFGLSAVPRAIGYWDTRAWVYAALSLTVIRMVPVAISLIGTKLSWFTVAFIGWFGPRGIASVLYLLIVVNDLGLKGYEQTLSVIVLTVLLSIYLHGVSAVPLSALYARRGEGKEKNAAAGVELKRNGTVKLKATKD
jgi:sodium/hydrogen antiporter